MERNAGILILTGLICVMTRGGTGACGDALQATPNLREVVIGNCEIYQANHPQFFCPDK